MASFGSILSKRNNRRYPRWFVPLFYIAALCTTLELVRAVDSWTDRVRALEEIGEQIPVSQIKPWAWRSGSPQSNRYLVEYMRNGARSIEVHSVEGKKLWSRNSPGPNSIFSSDGRYIFSGKEMLDARNGKTRIRVPVKKGMTLFWDTQELRAIWEDTDGYRIWMEATDKIQRISPEAASKLFGDNPDAWH